MKAIKLEYRTDGYLNNHLFPELPADLQGGLILQMPLSAIKEYLVGKLEVEELMSDDLLVTELERLQQQFRAQKGTPSSLPPPSLDEIKSMSFLDLADAQT